MMNEISLASRLRELLITGLQSERVTVYVGRQHQKFVMPRDVLCWRSSVFRGMLAHPLKEGLEGMITLPEVDAAAFGEFFVWAHEERPEVRQDLDIAEVIELAILEEIYMVEHLQNQTSDILRSKLDSGGWTLTPAIVGRVYEAVPAGCILRRLCTAKLGTKVKPDPWGALNVQSNPSPGQWRSVFERNGDLGWDFFEHCSVWQGTGSTLGSGDSCRFHVHRGAETDKKGIGGRCPAAANGGLEGWIEEQEVTLKPTMPKGKRRAKKDAKQRNQVRKAIASVNGPSPEEVFAEIGSAAGMVSYDDRLQDEELAAFDETLLEENIPEVPLDDELFR